MPELCQPSLCYFATQLNVVAVAAVVVVVIVVVVKVVAVVVVLASNLPWKFHMSRDQRELTIREVCKDCGPKSPRRTDLQVIQCNASNRHGYDFATGYINVLGKGLLLLLLLQLLLLLLDTSTCYLINFVCYCPRKRRQYCF